MSRKVKPQSPPQEDTHIQEFLDMIAPTIIKFNTDHFICGNTFRCVWTLRKYPTSTDEQAILRHLGEKDSITLRIYTRHVTPVEEKKIISMHPIRVGMTIGGLTGHLTSEFQKNINAVFKQTGFQLTWEQNMEGWLVSHAAHILPTAYICYSLDCNLKRTSKEQISLVVDAVVEAHKMLKKLEYPIRPDGEEEAFTKNRKKKQRSLYFMVKTPAGKYVISTHCAHAVDEMTALDQKFEELKRKAGMPMPAWDKLRNEAMATLENHAAERCE